MDRVTFLFKMGVLLFRQYMTILSTQFWYKIFVISHCILEIRTNAFTSNSSSILDSKYWRFQNMWILTLHPCNSKSNLPKTGTFFSFCCSESQTLITVVFFFFLSHFLLFQGCRKSSNSSSYIAYTLYFFLELLVTEF